MTDTPNTSRPSEAIQRYETDVRGEDRDPYPLDTDDERRLVLHCDHLAALARAREEARREALEALKLTVYTLPCPPLEGYPADAHIAFKTGWEECGNCIADNIEALLTPTPQGETKEND